MSNPIGGIQQPPVQSLINAGGSAAVAGKAGQRAGQQVLASNVSSPLSQSTDIAEEIGMAKSQFKKMDDRKLTKGDSRNAKMLELIRKIQSIEQIQGVDDFKDRLTNNPNSNLNRKDYQHQAENNFDDVFHQYIALYETADAYEALHGEGSAAEIYGAIEALESNNQQAIQIGLNLTEEAASLLAEKQLGTSLTDVRQEYFDHVKDHKTLATAYTDIIKRHGVGEGNFETAVDIQLKLLGADLNCLTSSTEEAHLRSVINDMTHLKRLVGIHDSCMETQEQISRAPHNIPLAGHEYMGRMLGMLDKQWITEADFSGLSRQMGINELATETFFMNKTADLIRDIPDEIFANTETKQNMRAAIQEVQDVLAIQEEGDGKSVDENHGVVGEVLLSGGILDDIAIPMGINLPGVTDNIMPEVMQSGEPSQDSATVPDKSTDLDGSSSKVPEATQEPANSKPVEIAVKGSLDGLSNKELRARQDVDIARAAELTQTKGEKYVVDSSLTALKDSLAHGADADNILRSLNSIAKARGGQFAKGLKIAITPKGSDKPLNLIPPGEELRGVANLEELVKTALTVLEEHEVANFSNYNPGDIEKELDKLKESISLMDSRMTSKPRGRSKGEKQYNQLEYSRKFNIRADQPAATVEATLDPPKDPSVSSTNQMQDLL
ncbi:TyeA family type III secretion system gatekeeper subunit [Endozoicomonas sp.]|uniref:TyeA family type III secretion system gatekeeper subunit n=1 Tax=Endozoicomonas sp. TaxID=1892382 RepID=UPI002884192B|nr:TyeA family type III secretion system gatekeeper subunit [Endozoicomonas sp.]